MCSETHQNVWVEVCPHLFVNRKKRHLWKHALFSHSGAGLMRTDNGLCHHGICMLALSVMQYFKSYLYRSNKYSRIGNKYVKGHAIIGEIEMQTTIRGSSF